ncbi:MAG: LamG domain-containing protein [Verrucomicrobiota bacterium]
MTTRIRSRGSPVSLCFFFCLSALMANSAPSPDGLVAAYSFDGNSRDNSGNGNDAIVVGATLTQDRFGVNGSAFHFDGTNHYIVVLAPKSLPLGNAARTITAWVKPEAASGSLAMVQQGNGECFGRIFGVGYVTNGLSFWGGCQDYTSKLEIPLGKWSFVAISHDPPFLRAFVNANSQSTNIGVLNTAASKLFIGAATTNNGASFRGFFKGSIDEINFYNRALNDAEIGALYGQTVQPSDLPRFQSIKLSTFSGCRLAFDGLPGMGYGLQASTNLLDWVTLTNFPVTSATTTFVDSNSTNQPRKFYRAKQIP